MCVSVYICMYSMCICIYVCVYVCICTYVCVYIHIAPPCMYAVYRQQIKQQSRTFPRSLMKKAVSSFKLVTVQWKRREIQETIATQSIKD